MSRTMAEHERYNSWYISFNVLCKTTWNLRFLENVNYDYFEFNAVLHIQLAR